MAEKKEEGKTSLDKGEKLDRIFTHFSVAAILTYIAKMLFDRLTEKGVEHFTKKVEAKLAPDTEKARTRFDDEGTYLRTILTEALGEEDANKALDFEGDLRQENPALAEAYVLALAKLARQFEEGGNKDLGSASVVKLVQLLIQRNTFEERVKFVKDRGIEALISPPKSDPVGKVVKFIKENQEANFDDLGTRMKSFRARAKEARRLRDERDKASRKA